jgi:ribosomal protein S6
MRHYEVMLILDPSLEDKDAKTAVDRSTPVDRGVDV